MTGSNTTVTIETEYATTDHTYPRDPWTAMHDLASQWEAEGWRYSIRHHHVGTIRERVTLTRYNEDGTIRERITLTEEIA